MSRVLRINSIEETELWRTLEKRNTTESKYLASIIIPLCEEASTRMKMMQASAPQYTLHDECHLLRTTELMAAVLGPEIERLNIVEVTLLILSAFFHDQGMVPLEDEIDSLKDNPEYILFRDNWIIEHPNYKEISVQVRSPLVSEDTKEEYFTKILELDSAMLTEYLRSSHGSRSEKYVRSTYRLDKRMNIQGINLAALLGRLCYSHTVSCKDLSPANGFRFDEQVGRYSVNMPYLAVILRLADILDFDRDRTPEVLLKNIHFTSQVSISEWEKHRSVEGWEISADRIRYAIRCTHPAYESSARVYMDWIDEEIINSKQVCLNQPQNIEAYELHLPSRVDRSRIEALDKAYRSHDLEFSLSRNEIVNLLMTDKLYGGEHLSIRELLQNSLDALRYRKALFSEAGFNWQKGTVNFRHYLNSDGYEVLECQDNGVGMDEQIINNHFVKVGRSFYRSPLFDQERTRLRASGNDFDPCSKFGIGFMSCFMLGDRITIFTRRDYGVGKDFGPPIVIEIHGLSGLLIIKDGDDKQPVGTTVSIVCRQKPSLLDSITDKVKLCLVLKTYALATEFSISAECEIAEISESVRIPVIMDKAQTQMEASGIIQSITLEQDLSDLSPDMHGYAKESFLLDTSGNPCISNQEAEWRINTDFGRGRWDLYLQSTDKFVEYDTNSSGVPVCADGILVTGTPGRADYRKDVRFRLGARNSFISFKSPALIDSRGELKPELTPGRTPPEQMGLNFPPGWQRLSDLFKQSLGLLWAQLAEGLTHGLSPEMFWKLCVIHQIGIYWIPGNLLSKVLSVSLGSSSDGIEWELVRNIGELKFEEGCNSSIRLIDSDGRFIGPSKLLLEWEKLAEEHPHLKWQMNSLTLLMSSLDIKENTVTLLPKEQTTPEPLWLYVSANYLGISRLYIDYIGVAAEAIAVETQFPTANRNHRLAVIAINSKYLKQPTDIQKFAQAFLPCIAECVSSRESTPDLESPSYWQKRVGYLYFDVQWEKYDAALRPPYRIWTKQKNWVSFDESDFKKWCNTDN